MRFALLLAVVAVSACASNTGSGTPSYSRDTAAATINDTLDAAGTLEEIRGDTARDTARDTMP